jgi:diacylglycerol kinase (ATP)
VSSPFGKAVVIADRRAHVGRGLDALSAMVAAAGIEFEVRPTSREAGAGILARRAVEEGATFLVAAGSDATIHLVVNGMMGKDAPVNPEAVLGVIPAGSDFIRTFGLPQGAAEAAAHLGGENVFVADVGLIRCTARGEPHRRWFVNVAEAGFGGRIVHGAGRLPPALGRVGRLVSFWAAMGRFSPVRCRIAMDERNYEGRVTNVVVANAQFVADGRPVAPRAHPGDGKFDVLVAKGGKRDYLEALTRMPKGLHLPSPAIREYMARAVEIDSDTPLPIGADGLPVGETPARFEVLEGALRLKI